jgi:serine/threonine-protein kinase HipA
MKFKAINKVKISLNFGNKIVEVGELALQNSKIYFKYFESFLGMELNISPYKLKLSNNLQTPDSQIFDGLFGVFDDSLPDGWGKLLVDRKLLASGINFSEINPLLRLSIVGNNGPGALVYQPEIDDEITSNESFRLDEIANEVNKIIADEPTNFLDELFHLGGSSGGARPKVNLAYNETTDQLFFGNTIPNDFDPWIIKFPSSYDPKDIANIEYAYYLMAKDAGLEMSNSKLFTGNKGNFYFGTKRFDRQGPNRIHMHSAAGMLHDNFRLSSLDYGHLMDCAFTLEKNSLAYEKVLRLATFNVFAHNRDDHSKNVSFLMDQKGAWELAPAYDITFSNSSHGHHSLTIAGESKSPGIEHLKKLAKSFAVKNIDEIIDQVKSAIEKWNLFADEAMISKGSRDRIGGILTQF